MANTDFSIASDTATGKVNGRDLHDELEAAAPYDGGATVFQGLSIDRGADLIRVRTDVAPQSGGAAAIAAVVAAHAGTDKRAIRFRETLFSSEIALPVGFGTLGSMLLAPKRFAGDLSKSWFRIEAVYSALLAGAQLRLTEKTPSVADNVVLGTVPLPATGGGTDIIVADFTTPPRPGRREYQFKADIGAASVAFIRSVRIILIEEFEES